MFKHMYQGGAVLEIFSAQGKDPVSKWKLYGGPSSICKVFDKEVMGYVYCLEGSCQNVKMQLPDDSKMSLGLIQRFLVLQVNVTQCKDFSIELVVTDAGHLKRRLYLSTVHKEFSATPLHARIPFVGLKRNIWSSLCIDLVSFIGGLFTSTAFLTLDGITVSAGCKLRRIFTMKAAGPEGTSDADAFFTGTGIMDLIPRSCQFLPEVQHVILLLNMQQQQAQQADVKTGVVDPCAPDQTTTRSARPRRFKIQDSSHIAFGSRVSGPPPQTAGRKNGGPSDGVDGGVGQSQYTCPTSSTGRDPICSTQSTERPSGNQSEKSSLGEPCQALHGNGTEFEHNIVVRPQPHPPKDRQASKMKKKIHTAGRERLASVPRGPDAVAGGHVDRSEATSSSTTSPCRGESSPGPLTPTEMTGDQTSDELPNNHHTPPYAKEHTGSSSDLVESSSPWSSSPAAFYSGHTHGHTHGACRSDEESPEPDLTLEEEVFTFSSQPHSARLRVQQVHGEQEERTEASHYEVQTKTRRCNNGAQPEDDFVASESDEEEIFTKFFHQRAISVGSSPVSVRSPDTAGGHLRPGQTLPEKLHPANNGNILDQSRRRAEPTGMLPTRCLSPNSSTRILRDCCSAGPELASSTGLLLHKSKRTSLCRRFLQELSLEDGRLHKEAGGDTGRGPFMSGSCQPDPRSSVPVRGDDEDEELRMMLASLQREQQEDEGGASGLSASQIRQCHVSMSMSSDDTSTWTHMSMPANQGQHYQKEMNPLLHSNPREWMDVLSPPIIPPSQQRRSDNTWHHHKDLIKEGDVWTEGSNEEEYLNLLYDPCLNCYFDPQTGKYYELA